MAEKLGLLEQIGEVASPRWDGVRIPLQYAAVEMQRRAQTPSTTFLKGYQRYVGLILSHWEEDVFSRQVNPSPLPELIPAHLSPIAESRPHLCECGCSRGWFG